MMFIQRNLEEQEKNLKPVMTIVTDPDSFVLVGSLTIILVDL